MSSGILTVSLCACPVQVHCGSCLRQWKSSEHYAPHKLCPYGCLRTIDLQAAEDSLLEDGKDDDDQDTPSSATTAVPAEANGVEDLTNDDQEEQTQAPPPLDADDENPILH